MQESTLGQREEAILELNIYEPTVRIFCPSCDSFIFSYTDNTCLATGEYGALSIDFYCTVCGAPLHASLKESESND